MTSAASPAATDHSQGEQAIFFLPCHLSHFRRVFTKKEINGCAGRKIDRRTVHLKKHSTVCAAAVVARQGGALPAEPAACGGHTGT